MKLVVLCLFAVVCVVYAVDQYTNKFDDIDIDQILTNERLLRRHVDCLLEKPNVRCPSAALELKNIMDDALETECAKCSDRQKEMAKKMIKYMVENKKSMWDELKAKYDPEGKYMKKYEGNLEELFKEGSKR